MSKDIVLDENAFETAAKEYGELALKIDQFREDVEGMLNALHKGFDTPAGEKFDNSCRNNLLEPIDKQKKVIEHIQENLSISKNEYQKVFEEYRQLNKDINSYSQ